MSKENDPEFYVHVEDAEMAPGHNDISLAYGA